MRLTWLLATVLACGLGGCTKLNEAFEDDMPGLHPDLTGQEGDLGSGPDDDLTGEPPRDIGGNPRPDLDHGPDLAGKARLEATLSAVSVVENCLPPIATDPVKVTARLAIQNVGTAAAGPIKVTDGTILDKAGTELGKFKVNPLTLAVIPAGGNDSGDITKTANSFSPANHCSSLICGSQVSLEVPYSGPGVPGGAKATSALVRVVCTL